MLLITEPSLQPSQPLFEPKVLRVKYSSTNPLSEWQCSDLETLQSGTRRHRHWRKAVTCDPQRGIIRSAAISEPRDLIFCLYGFQCSDLGPGSWSFYTVMGFELIENVEVPISLFMLRHPFINSGFSVLFCCPAFWIQSLVSARKAPELSCSSLWLCSTKRCIIYNLLTSLPQQLPKIPLVRNAIIRRGGCFVTHTVSLKRFFSQTNFQ